jgi:hypothetical protein
MIVTDGRTDHCTIRCESCSNLYTMMYNREDMTDWLSGSLFIQDAMPYLSDNERELLLSGICGECFEKFFPSIDN